ncbi:MAG: NAD-dependent epimerase/dehydratase family protein [Candidatus Hydrogenedentes bacterium]|nr:NAD-dependent epimerase/dehydratase family protein [Candidatus Hydrogenedentota bacterium]
MGFLGSHICDRLIAEGIDVICMDNLITGNEDNIKHLIGNPMFKLIQYDVTNYIYVEGKLDFILHFASPESPKDYLNYPIQTLKVGSLGTLNSIGLAKAKNAVLRDVSLDGRSFENYRLMPNQYLYFINFISSAFYMMNF